METDDFLIHQDDPQQLVVASKQLETEGMAHLRSGDPYIGEELMVRAARLEHAAREAGSMALDQTLAKAA